MNGLSDLNFHDLFYGLWPVRRRTGTPGTHGDAPGRTETHERTQDFHYGQGKEACAGVGAKCFVITKFVHPKKTYKLCWIILAEYLC
jgi:hypothetical protein